jgi:hypothetical protein
MALETRRRDLPDAAIVSAVLKPIPHPSAKLVELARIRESGS